MLLQTPAPILSKVTPHYAEMMTDIDEKDSTSSRGAVFDPLSKKLYLALNYEGQKTLAYVHQLVGQAPNPPSRLEVTHLLGVEKN